MNVDSQVRVAVRCRPAVGTENFDGSYTFLTCKSEQKQIELDEKLFSYDYVFDSTASQSDVYEGAVAKLTEKFLSGSNAAVIAYGQTGSGKTHTMGTNDEDDGGIVPRTLRQIFESTSTETLDGTNLLVSFLEVYNEEVYDLLDEKRPKILLRDDSIKVSASTEMPVRSYDDAMVCLSNGIGIRTTGATAMNIFSSRSHAIFSVVLERKIAGETRRCQMTMVDLAGSEVAKKTKTTGKRFTEGVNINHGLFVLGKVVNTLSRIKGNGYIPYRESTLTKLLKNCLHGNCHTLMIVCISPLEESLQETMSSLRFADHALAVKVKPNVQSQFSASFSGRKKAPDAGGVPSCTRTPFRAVRQRPSPYPVRTLQSDERPISVFDLDSSPCSSDGLQFKKPRTPAQTSSISKDLFSPLVRRICSTIETSMDRVADRLALGSRNVIDTPARESIVHSIVKSIAIARRSFVSGASDSQDLSTFFSPQGVCISSKSRSTFEDETMIESKENETTQAERRQRPRRSTRLTTATSSNDTFSDRTTTESYINVTGERTQSSGPVRAVHPRRSRILTTFEGDDDFDVNQSMVMSTSRQDVHTANILRILNRASVRELQHLPCVGPKSAVILHNWRTKHGPFREIRDLKRVHGLGNTFAYRFGKGNMVCLRE